MNKISPFAEEPTQADADRIVDILFPSHFTHKKEEWNAEKYIYIHSNTPESEIPRVETQAQECFYEYAYHETDGISKG
jgi:hypothetical protein